METADRVWVSRWVETVNRRFGHPVLAGIVALGWVPAVATVLVFSFEHDSVSSGFVLWQSLTASIVVFGPYQAWKYDTDVLPSFFEAVRPVVAECDRETFDEIERTQLNSFRDRYLFAVVLWTIMVVSVISVNSTYFAAQGIEPWTPSYVLYLVFLVDFGFLSGLGLYSGWITVQSIRDVAALSLDIQPLHEDGVGGLGSMGELAGWTALLIANGALAIPLALDMAPHGTAYIVYAGICIYIVVIAVSFLYPLATVYRQTRERRIDELEEYRREIQSLSSEVASPATESSPDQEEVALRLRIEQLRSRYRDYENVRLYPASVGAATRFGVSVLLPVALSLVGVYVPV